VTAHARQRGDVSARTTVRVAWKLLRRDPVAYAISWVQWVTFHSMPLAVGWAFKLVLDRVTGDTPAASPWGMLAVLGGFELARWALLLSAAVQWHGAFVGWLTVPRVNLLESLTCAPGPAAGRLPSSPGEAVSRFRDDAQDLGLVLDVWLDISGAVAAAIGAVVVMAAIDGRVTIAIVVPMVAALALARWLGPRLRTWRRASREATARVTGFIGDTFAAVLAVKAAGAEEAVVERFAAINHQRAGAAHKDQVGTQLVQSLSGITAAVSTGVLLLLIAPAIRQGDFTIGELGLFTSYVVVLAGLPRWAGRLGAYHRQADVSVGRLAALLPEPDADAVVAPVTTYLRHGPPPLPPPDRRCHPLDELAVDGLRAGGLGGVDLTVRRGELVAVTGAVGAGKSTLVRALLGLIPVEAGTITWNGEVVADPSTFLVPPRVAYLPQVPRLFSEQLAETVLLGLPDDDLDAALWLACLDDDVADMVDGAATMVGPRGVRLSGGQIQRVAAARAFVRRPDLLVVDDLSSALDVETEARLWERLFASGLSTALVVTHRERVLDRADRVVVLDRGRAVTI
jgi:ATP-binding cassette subfamily B protein